MFTCNLMHVVMPSINPLFFTITLTNMILNSLQWLMWAISPMVELDILLFVMSILFWYYDVILESTQADHTNINTDSFKYSFLLFVSSEFMLFFSLFWLLFSNEFSPEMNYASSFLYIWSLMTWKTVPLLNTVILLTSSVTLTKFHYETIFNKPNMVTLLITIILGVYFMYLQFMEYQMNKFSMSDGVICSTFYILTMFHACHVMVGMLFMTFMMSLLLVNKITSYKNIMMECSIIYWHFVDVVWLFLFIFLYYWPS